MSPRPAKSSKKNRKADNTIQIPHDRDWRTTDTHEINRRWIRAREERFSIRNTCPSEKIFSTFQVGSGSGMSYSVEIRDIADKHVSCTCQRFQDRRPGDL